MDGGLGNAGVGGQGADTPMGDIVWWTLPCRMEHLGHPLIIMGAGPARALLVVQSFNPLVVKARALFANGDVADGESLGRLQVGVLLQRSPE